MRENRVDIIQEDGGFCAAARGEGIFTQGDTWQELGDMVQEATELHLCDDLGVSTSFRVILCREGNVTSTLDFTSAIDSRITTH